MSTKTLGGPGWPYSRPGAGPGPVNRLILFLALSLAIHLGVIGGVFVLVPETMELPEPDKPIVVDVVDLPEPDKSKIADVIELPPGPVEESKDGKPPRVFADRTQSVEEEIIPAPSGADNTGGVRVEPSAPKASKGGDLPKGIVMKTPGYGGFEEKGSEGKDIIEKKGISLKGDQQAELVGDLPDPLSPGKQVDADSAGGEWGGADDLPGVSSLVLGNVDLKDIVEDGDTQGATYVEEEKNVSIPADDPNLTYNAKARLRVSSVELVDYKYLLNIKNRVSLRWFYPPLAAREGWQGRLLVHFIIRKDGTIEGLELKKSTGYPVLDDAAITAIKLAAPFLPLPESFGHDKLNINYTFQYIISN